MKSRLVFCMVAIISLFLALVSTPMPQASAQVVTPLPPITPPPFPPLPPILPPQPVPPRPIFQFPEIRYERVEVTIDGQVALTKVEMLFANKSPVLQEGTYLFPLPADAAISSLTMWADGQKMTGEILDKAKARQIYENIVRQRRDPALLQYVGSKAVELRVFPIPPGGERKVQLEYSLVLNREAGLIRYAYPLAGTSFPGQTLKELTITAHINASQPILNIYSPSHDVSVVRKGDTSADVSYEAGNVSPSKDFELFYSVDNKDVGVNLLTYKTGDQGYFLLLASPRPDLSQTQIVPRDVILVIDISGSMGGVKIEQAKQALKFILEHLNQDDRFNIISFSSEVDMFAKSMQPLSAKDKALDYVNGLRAAGSTNINDALLAAAGLVAADRPAVVIFVTDGQPTIGVTDNKEILTAFEKASKGAARLFAFGIGDDVNANLLDLLAQNNHGISQYVRRDDQVLPVVTSFYEKIGAPVLMDLSIDFGSAQVEDVYPRPLPDLYIGGQLTVVGRYRAAGETTLTVTGKSNGKDVAVSYPNIAFTDKADSASFIPRLWATRKIGYLLDQIRLRGSNQEVIDEIKSLSAEFGIMTPYTSYFIQENVPVPQPWPVPGPMGPGGPMPTLTPWFQGGAVPKAMPYPMMGGASGSSAGPSSPPAMSQIDQSQQAQRLKQSETSDAGMAPQTRAVADKTFVYQGGRWVDTKFKQGVTSVQVAFGSQEYFRLLEQHSEWARYFAVGDQVVVVLDGKAYIVTDDGSQAIPPAGQGTVSPVSTPGSVNVITPDAGRTGPGDPAGLATGGSLHPQSPVKPAPNVFQRIWDWITHLFGR